MATFRRKGQRYEAQIFKRGVRRSRTFHRLTDAKAWALKVEAQIERGSFDDTVSDMPLADLIDRYEREISKHKRSYAAEAKRLAAIRDWPIAKHGLQQIDATVIAEWRDWRLTQVKPGTLLRHTQS